MDIGYPHWLMEPAPYRYGEPTIHRKSDLQNQNIEMINRLVEPSVVTK